MKKLLVILTLAFALTTFATAVPQKVCDTCEIPQDFDSDTLFEDVNGDGVVNNTDTQLLMDNQDLEPDYFDFNGDGQYDTGDAQSLSSELNYEPPALLDNNEGPNDLDNDTLYEDVNGDGSFTFFDVLTMYDVYLSEEEKSKIDSWALNFDGAEGISQGDYQALYHMFSDGSVGALCDSCSPAQSIDEDIRYEDVNGDGEFNRKDYLKLYDIFQDEDNDINQEGTDLNKNIWMVDFDANGQFTFFDVLTLYDELISRNNPYGDVDQEGDKLIAEEGDTINVFQDDDINVHVEGQNLSFAVDNIQEGSADLTVEDQDFSVSDGQELDLNAENFYRFRVNDVSDSGSQMENHVSLEVLEARNYQVKVLDMDDNPLDEANVEVNGQSYQTSSDGTADISGEIIGEDLQASHEGHKSKTETVENLEDGIYTIRLEELSTVATVTLSSGWNMVSVPDVEGINGVAGFSVSDLETACNLQTFEGELSWMFSGDSWTHPSTITSRQGVFLSAASSCETQIELHDVGDQGGDSLEEGWNLVSVPGQKTLDQVSGTCEFEQYEGKEVWRYGQQSWNSMSAVTALNPSNGYYVYANTACEMDFGAETPPTP